MRELELQRALLIAAPAALPAVRLFRRNIVNASSQSLPGVRLRAGIKGQADIYGLVRGGRHIEIELKSATGRLRPEQERWRDWCREWGIEWVLLEASRLENPDETVRRWLSELRTFL